MAKHDSNGIVGRSPKLRRICVGHSTRGSQRGVDRSSCCFFPVPNSDGDADTSDNDAQYNKNNRYGYQNKSRLAFLAKATLIHRLS